MKSLYSVRRGWFRGFWAFLFLSVVVVSANCVRTTKRSHLSSGCDVWTEGGGLRPASKASLASFSAPTSWQEIKRVFIVILENTDAKDSAGLKFMSRLGKEGAVLQESYAITHPSQPNYIALTSGETHGVDDNNPVTLDVQHLGNLLEAQGMRWKLYAESFPGNCYLNEVSGKYARRHVPFLSYKNVTSTPSECANIVDASELVTDIQNKALPEFAMYVPNNDNNGHDTGPSYADQWLSRTFEPLLNNKDFADGTLFIVTYDESLSKKPNKILTVFYGAGVQPGSTALACYDHYSILATVEKILGLGNLGKRDSQAPIIDGIWKDTPAAGPSAEPSAQP